MISYLILTTTCGNGNLCIQIFCIQICGARSICDHRVISGLRGQHYLFGTARKTPTMPLNGVLVGS